MKRFILGSAAFALLAALVGSSPVVDSSSATALADESQTMFPFVIEKGAPDNIANVGTWDDPIPVAGADGFLAPKDGEFATASGRKRLFGTNLCFGASFTTKEKAERLAETLARFGINAVRLHHMDARDIWGENFSRTMTEIDPNKLERLDYLIYCLRRKGIYVDINLHVSRAFDGRDGFENADRLPTHTKGVDNFERRMIAFQKKYANDLLKHVNPYTGKAYVDDPGVAVVEINNENSVVASWSWGELDNLPEPYCDDFRALWNGWLTKKYGSTDKLRAAWESRDYPLGPETIDDDAFADGFEIGGPWEYQRDGESKATWKLVPKSETGIDANALRFDVEKMGAQSWIPQAHRVGLALEAGKPYRVSFKIRSEKSSSISVSVRENHDPWSELGFTKTIDATPDWKDVEIAFVAPRSDSQVRLTFGSFDASDSIELANVSFREGGTVGLPTDARLEDGSVPLLKRNGGGNLIGERGIADFSDFLRDIENDYWQEMFGYVEGLGTNQPITGTQLQYGFWHNQARLDYCDIHAYWNHPNFPRKSWDGNDWLIGNTCLANSPESGTLASLAALRVVGKPFTCSEYDHPYPNLYCAEGNVMLAAVAAFQDWGGTFQFAWSHGDDFERRTISAFFDECSQTVKLAHLPACYAMFVRGDVKSGPGEFVYAPSMTEAEESELMRGSLTGYHRSLEGLKIDKSLSLAVYAGVALPDVAAEPPAVAKAKKISGWADLPERLGSKEKKEIVNEFGQLRWNFQKENAGYFVVDAPNCKVFSGFTAGIATDGGESVCDWDGVRLSVGETELGWSTISLVKATNVDKTAESSPILTPGRYLLTATGLMKNTGAVIEQVDERNVTTAAHFGGSNGEAPALCEGIPAKVVLKGGLKADSVDVYALNERGDRAEKLTVAPTPDGCAFEIGPGFKTIWYEIVVK